MNAQSKFADVFFGWIDAVAALVVAQIDRLARPRMVTLIETGTGDLALSGEDPPSVGNPVTISQGTGGHSLSAAERAIFEKSRIELVLRPAHFLFPTLELPGRAAEFLESIIRAQIDKLTPWNAGNVVFGWTQPIIAASDRIAVTIAATAAQTLNPYMKAITALGVRSITVSTTAPDDSEQLIKVLSVYQPGTLDLAFVRRMLIIVLLGSAAVTMTAVGGAAVLGNALDEQHEGVADQIAKLRSAAVPGQSIAPGSVAAAQQALVRRKNDVQSTVVILESLSQLLPDHTHITEFRIEDNKVRLTGFTRDAPTLIGLIEQSGLFSGATFFAPTTRSAADSGDRFYIEAQIRPIAAARS